MRSRGALPTHTTRMLVPSAAGGLRLVRAYEAPPPDRPGLPGSSHSVALAIEAVEVASPAVRRLMHQAGFTPSAIDTESKRHRRLIKKLRDGAELNRREERFVAGALAIMSVLHLTSPRRAGGQGRTVAKDFERAASELMERPTDFSDDAPASRKVPRLAVGERVVEIATERSWWVDELRTDRPDLVGVIPDVGDAEVQWRAARDFQRGDRTVG